VLATLADSDEMRLAIAARGGVRLLVQLLQRGGEETAREAAAAALAVLAIAPDNKTAIAREQVRQPFAVGKLEGKKGSAGSDIQPIIHHDYLNA
jgi:hypothetical protein